MLHELAQRFFDHNDPQPDEPLATFTSSTARTPDDLWIQHVLRPLLDFSCLNTLSQRPLVNLYQSTNNRGGGDFWRASASEHGLDITWGQHGTVEQTRHLTRDTCYNADPVAELLSRTLKKILSGYTLDRATTLIPGVRQPAPAIHL